MSDKATKTNKDNVRRNVWSGELLAIRRQRARITGLILGGFVILFFIVTVVRLGANILNRPL